MPLIERHELAGKLFHTLMQRELDAARAELLQKRTELETVREQKQEITDELAWVVKDLLRLKKKDNNDRCQSWLLSSQGLSTVLAKQNSARAKQAGRSQTPRSMGTPSPTDSSSIGLQTVKGRWSSQSFQKALSTG